MKINKIKKIVIKIGSSSISSIQNGLNKSNINILVISTSEIKISVLVNKKNINKALLALHTEFKLDK